MALISVVKIVAAFSWLALFAVLGIIIVKAARQQKSKGITTILVIVAVFALFMNVLSAGLVFIEPTERGVVISALEDDGLRDVALQPGLNWIVPYFDRVVTYVISRQTYTMSIAHGEGQIKGDDSVEGRTSDGQVVFVDASVIYAIDPNKVIQLHVDWQNTYQDSLVRPLARGIIRDAISDYGIEEVYSVKRVEVTSKITAELSRKLEQEGLVLVDFILRNIAFSPEYADSVEQKQVAEQQAQQAFFVVEQRKQEAEQVRQQAEGLADAAVIAAQGQADSLVINAEAEAEARLIQAQAEAEALRLLGEALEEYPDVLVLEYIDKIAPSIRVMLLPNDNPFLLNLPGLDDGLTQ